MEQFEYYKPNRPVRKRNYSVPPTDAELVQDLNTAHANIKKLVKEKDALQHRYHWLKVWNRVQWMAILAQWAVLLTFLKLWLDHK